MYSQFDEERVILEYFRGSSGFFLDIGAFDGVTLSNTRCLIELGWRGVLVEPAPFNMVKIIENTKGYADRVILVQCAIVGSSRSNLRRLVMNAKPEHQITNSVAEDAISDGLIVDVHPSKLFVPTFEIRELSIFGTYDFISIDAEWEDMGILSTIPDRMLEQARMICVEYRDEFGKRETEVTLESRGFKVVHETMCNVIGAK